MSDSTSPGMISAWISTPAQVLVTGGHLLCSIYCGHDNRRHRPHTGTLYLYFKTREDVLLALYNAQFVCWCAELSGSVTADMSDQAFAGLFFKTMRRDPLFLQLLARLDSVIEHNVSFEALVESKKLMIEQLQQMSPMPAEYCVAFEATTVPGQ